MNWPIVNVSHDWNHVETKQNRVYQKHPWIRGDVTILEVVGSNEENQPMLQSQASSERTLITFSTYPIVV
jgi:hypothetical protein